MNRTAAFVTVAVVSLICATMLGGCWMVDVAPLKGHCARWAPANTEGLGTGEYVLIPCPGGM